MSAFPVMNPGQGLQGKQALLQKLLGQYQKMRGNKGINGYGGGSPLGIGGGPPGGIGGGLLRGSLSHLGMTGASHVNPNLNMGALIPRALGGEYSGMPGMGIDQQHISQIPGIIQQFGGGGPGGGPGAPSSPGTSLTPGGFTDGATGGSNLTNAISNSGTFGPAPSPSPGFQITDPVEAMRPVGSPSPYDGGGGITGGTPTAGAGGFVSPYNPSILSPAMLQALGLTGINSGGSAGAGTRGGTFLYS